MKSSTYHRPHRIIAAILIMALLSSLVPPQRWNDLFGPSIVTAVSSIPSDSQVADINLSTEKTLLSDNLGHLSQSSLISPEGEPSDMFVDLGALQSLQLQREHQPTSLANPLSVSHVQSISHTQDSILDTLIITFTVTNNQKPAVVHNRAASATITDTIASLSALDLSQDPNTIHHVLLTDSFINDAVLVSSSLPADKRESHKVWNLGHISPLSSVTVTIQLRGPSSVPDFVELDTGAKAWGTLYGSPVSATASPIILAPNSFFDWLVWTIDADHYDEYVVQKAAEFDNDPLAIFKYVRSLGYEGYKGSLRGARGTLWSEAGNSLDQASLLIAMLRASGIPARYRHGTLETAQAQDKFWIAAITTRRIKK